MDVTAAHSLQAGGRAVPGNPEMLEGLARQCERVASALWTDLGRVRGAATVPGWSGEAAEAFARAMASVPRDLALAAESYQVVGHALRAHASELRLAQRRGEHVTGELRCVLGRFESLARTVAQGGADPTADPQVAALLSRRGELERALRGAQEDALASGELAARRVRAASDAPHEPPGLWGRLVDAAGDYVLDHAEGLTLLADGLAEAATVFALVAYVPGLEPLAAVAAICAVAAALLRTALAWKGKVSILQPVDDLASVSPLAKGAGRAVTNGLPWRERMREAARRYDRDQRDPRTRDRGSVCV